MEFEREKLKSAHKHRKKSRDNPELTSVCNPHHCAPDSVSLRQTLTIGIIDMKPTSAQKRAFLAALFLLGTTLSVSGCSLLGSSRATKPGQPEQTGIVVYAIKDIPEGYEISNEALEERELSYSKIPQDAITSASLALGRNAKYGIAAGQIVSQHDIAPRTNTHKVSVDLTVQEYSEVEELASRTDQAPEDLVHDWIVNQLTR